MSLLKKHAGILALIVLVMIIAGILIVLAGKKQFADDPLKAVPSDAAFILCIKSFNNLEASLKKDNKIWEDMLQISFFNKINSLINYYDSLFVKNEKLKKSFNDLSLLIVGNKNRNNRVDYVIIVNAPGDLNKGKFNEFLKIIVNYRTEKITRRKFNGFWISELKIKDDISISLCYINNQIIISTNPELVEKSVLQTKAENSLSKNPTFNKANMTAGNSALANVFIQYSKFPQLFNKHVLKPHLTFLEDFSDYAAWSSLDLNVKPDEISLGGFTLPGKNTLDEFSVFINQTPQKIGVAGILPSSTAFMVALGFQDIHQYIRDKKNSGSQSSHFDQIKEENKKFSIQIDESIYSIFGHEIVLAYTSFNDLAENENVLVAVQTQSAGIAESKMKEILSAYSKIANKTVDAFTLNKTIDNEVNYKIYHLPIYRLPGKVFGSLFNPIEDPYYTFIDNYMVFSNSARLLERLKNLNILQQSLANDYSYKDFSQSYSELSNVLIYSSISNSKNLYKNYLSQDSYDSIFSNSKAIQYIDRYGIQFSSNDNMLYTNAFIKYSESDNTLARTEWKTLLDTVINFKPQLIENHINHQNEIFVQDLKNNIYLISQSGRILWKIPIGEKIMNQVYQVDAYHNNKMQILFNTNSKIYLIDRNGNMVENFPVILRSPATAGVAVFDYENDRNYRLFVPCQDKKVYAYEINGQLVQGWDFNRTEGIVNQVIQHFKVGDKDYIVFNDDFRTYIQDRKGNERVAVTSIIPASSNNKYILDVINEKNKPRMMITDTSGTVNYVYFDGTVEKKSFGHFSANHFFDFKDLTGDLNEEYIFLDNNTVKAFSQSGKKIFEYHFNENINEPFVYFQFSQLDRKLGVVSSQSNRIYLINNNGKLYNGFPLTGNTLFSIGRLNPAEPRFNLLVGNSDNFLLNYSVK